MPISRDCHNRLNWMNRCELKTALESACIQVYDDESEQELREAVLNCLENDDILPSQLPAWNNGEEVD